MLFRLAAAFIMFVSAVLDAGSVLAQQRLPTIPPDQYTVEQKKAADEFLATRKVPVFGPFEPMMHSPEVMNMARAMGDYLRYHSAIGNTLSELVILITAREWSQDYEWYVHYPIALKAGIAKDIADAIADGRRPTAMSTIKRSSMTSRLNFKKINAFRTRLSIEPSSVSAKRVWST